MNYLKQKATPWVTFSVLAGGIVSAMLLYFLVRVENDVQNIQHYADEEEYLNQYLD